MAKPTFTRIVTEVRKDISVPFYEYSEEEISYRQRVMMDSGNVLSETVEISEDQLTRTTTTTFVNYEARTLLSNDIDLTEINLRRTRYNRINFIRGSKKAYEGNDSSLAISGDNLVARYSSSDPACMTSTEKDIWKETNRTIGTQFNIEGEPITVGKELLYVSHLIPVGNFTYDENSESIVLDGGCYFTTDEIQYSTFADIELKEKSFFISFIPDLDSFSQRTYLISKLSTDSSKGWCLYYETDGSLNLEISSHSTKKTYSTTAGKIIAGKLNTVGITASLSDTEGSIKLFVNGQEHLSSKHGIDNPSNYSLLRVGTNDQGQGNFKGKLLGFRVYYRTLEVSEFDILHRLFAKQLEN